MPEYSVRDWLDVLYVQGTVARYAAELGFAKRDCQELAIVASELGSNIVKYGVHGVLRAEARMDAEGSGIALIAVDHGPPFRSLESALQDGYDDQGPIDPVDMVKRRGIGGGLGAVVRFTHSLRVEEQDGGKRIVAVRYLRPPGR